MIEYFHQVSFSLTITNILETPLLHIDRENYTHALQESMSKFWLRGMGEKDT